MEQTSQTIESGRDRSLVQTPILVAIWYCLGFGIFLALGISNLFYPFGDDQAVLFFAAKDLDQGARLYVEYWGNKQPGLYFFYLWACQLFGFTEFGVHLLELIWMSAFAVVLMITMRPCFQARWLSALVPLATIGLYYATALQDELTQLEILVAFPLYLVAWSALRALDPPGGAKEPEGEVQANRMVLLFFFSGLCAGFATIFKLLLAPIPVAFWLIASFYLFREHRLSLAVLVVRVWMPVAIGVILPLGAVVLWFWQIGALKELLWTAFIYPPRSLVYLTGSLKNTAYHGKRFRTQEHCALAVVRCGGDWRLGPEASVTDGDYDAGLDFTCDRPVPDPALLLVALSYTAVFYAIGDLGRGRNRPGCPLHRPFRGLQDGSGARPDCRTRNAGYDLHSPFCASTDGFTDWSFSHQGAGLDF